MIARSNLQLLSAAGGQPGSIGFKLTGKAREGEGLCRIWLRKGEPWDRYLDPRVRSDAWDVRAYRRLDSAFAVFEEFTLSTLDDIANDYDFPNADGLGALALNGDPIHDHVLRWARSVTGAPEAGAAP